MNRYTFVIHVHPDGPTTLENLSTHERVPLSDLDAVGAQIERWLSALPYGVGPQELRLDAVRNRVPTGGDHAQADP
jgi:hypothetical protein